MSIKLDVILLDKLNIRIEETPHYNFVNGQKKNIFVF